MKTRLMIALVETVGAAFIAYHQMPVDQQQRIRMKLYYCGYHACAEVALRAGRLGIMLQNKYAREGSANG